MLSACARDETTSWKYAYMTMLGAYGTTLICLVLLCCTCFVWWFYYIGMVGLYLGSLLQLWAIITIGVLRYDSIGEKCASNREEIFYNESDAFTFKEHGNYLQGLFIAACIYCCLNFCQIYFMILSAKSLVLLRKRKRQD